MNFVVLNEAGILVKAHPTFITLVRPFSSMSSLMFDEAGVVSIVSTSAVLISLFPSVNSDDCGAIHKELPTFAALVSSPEYELFDAR